MQMQDSFLYFGFGSNLCADRIHISNPSAEFVSIARLDGYRIAFTLNSSRWKGVRTRLPAVGPGDYVLVPGAAADLIEDPGASVWGVLWRLEQGDSDSLDRQEGVWVEEGVDIGSYKRLAIQVC